MRNEKRKTKGALWTAVDGNTLMKCVLHLRPLRVGSRDPLTLRKYFIFQVIGSALLDWVANLVHGTFCLGANGI